MASEATLTFTDDAFEADVLNSDQPVLVDFWAEWCMPCKALTPTIDELASEFQGRAKVGKMNIDDHRNVAIQHHVHNIPTVLVFNKGEVVAKWVGPKDKAEYAQALADLV